MSRVHVAVDLRILDREGMERTGVGRHALESVKALRDARPDWTLTVHSNRPKLVGEGERTLFRRTPWPTGSSLGRVSWLHLMPGRAIRPAPDLWLGPTFFLPRAWRGPSVVAIHDLVFKREPALYRGRLNARYAALATSSAAARADLVLCGSTALRELIVRDLGVPRAKVRTIPWGGVGDTFRRGDGPGNGRYWLFVGRWEARKGLDVLHAARRIVADRGAPARLTLAGGPGWGAHDEVAALLNDPEVEAVVDPSDGELAELYAGALALVHPSRIEGFGLPVAEAMASGCPVIASDLPEVREWAGDAPLYVPPGDAERLAHALIEISGDASARERMSNRGMEVTRSLSWETVGEAVAEAIEDVLAKSRSRSGP